MNDLLLLIRYLCKEKEGISIDYRVDTLEEAKEFYQNLCTIRLPKDVSLEFLERESQFLDSELKKSGIVFWNTLSHHQKLELWNGDITRLSIETIVNPTTPDALGCFDPQCSCINRRIHLNAGISLRNECHQNMMDKEELSTGEVISTSSYHLPCDMVFHVLFPIIQDDFSEIQKQQLKDCYIHCLDLARENNIRTIAFPCVVFESHQKSAIEIAVSTIKEYLKEYSDFFDLILFCTLDEKMYSYYKEVL